MKRAWVSPRRVMAVTKRDDGTKVRLFKRRGYWKVWVSGRDGRGFAMVCDRWRGTYGAKWTYNHYRMPGI